MDIDLAPGERILWQQDFPPQDLEREVRVAQRNQRVTRVLAPATGTIAGVLSLVFLRPAEPAAVLAGVLIFLSFVCVCATEVGAGRVTQNFNTLRVRYPGDGVMRAYREALVLTSARVVVKSQQWLGWKLREVFAGRVHVKDDVGEISLATLAGVTYERSPTKARLRFRVATPALSAAPEDLDVPGADLAPEDLNQVVGILQEHNPRLSVRLTPARR